LVVRDGEEVLVLSSCGGVVGDDVYNIPSIALMYM
jgi:hypothetical protein